MKMLQLWGVTFELSISLLRWSEPDSILANVGILKNIIYLHFLCNK